MLPLAKEKFLQCEKCKHYRPEQYFQSSSSLCIACAFHAEFERCPCGKCDKPTSMQHWSGIEDEYGQRLCTGFAPEAASLECYFCKKTKRLQCFSLKRPAVEIMSMTCRDDQIDNARLNKNRIDNTRAALLQ